MENNLDQFYTNKVIAKKCITELEREIGCISTWKNILEPSAGSGCFLDLLPPHSIGLDLDPRSIKVIQTDYLLWSVPDAMKNCIVIGNPPFGKNSSLAVKFFNKSATFAKVIAFIVPRTFRKDSIINRLNKQFHLAYETVLPVNSFHTPAGDIKNVPTCFQIWKLSQIIRSTSKKKLEEIQDWDWVKDRCNATHAIRRVGVNAGKLVQIENASQSSHFFIKSNINDISKRWEILYLSHWNEEKEYNPKWDVAGNPSLTKKEIICFYNGMYKL